MPEETPAALSFPRVRLDRARCRLSAAIRSPEPLPRQSVAVLVRDRAGEISSGGELRTSRIPAGSSRQVLDSAGRRCPGFAYEVELFPHRTPLELIGAA
jgi:hypothetical protein